MGDDRLAIGIVGLGTFVELAHFPAYLESPYRELVRIAAICDLDPKRLAAVGDKYGLARRFTDHRAMLGGEKLDVVVVATPDHAHTAIALDAIAAGKDVLVEKPLAMKAVEARAIADAADQAGRLVITDFHKREDPCHVEARTRFRRGDYGPLQLGWAWMQDAIAVAAGGFFKSDLASRSSPNWFLGVHFYDLVCFLTGAEPVEARAVGHRRVLAARGIDTYDAIKADFVFAGGAAVSVTTSWNLPDAAPFITRQGIYLQCARGDIEIDSSRRGFAATTEEGYRFVNPMFQRATPRGYAGYGVESIGEAMRVFHARARGRPAPTAESAHLATAREGLTATLMAEGVDRSLAAGRKEEHADVGAQVVLAAILQ